MNEDDSSFVEMCGPGSEIQIEVVDVDKLPDGFNPLSTEELTTTTSALVPRSQPALASKVLGQQESFYLEDIHM